MLILLRIFLIVLLIALVVRSFSKPLKGPGSSVKSGEGDSLQKRKVSDETGEYVDYEEVKEKSEG